MKTSYSKSPMYKTRAFTRKKKCNVPPPSPQQQLSPTLERPVHASPPKNEQKQVSSEHLPNAIEVSNADVPPVVTQVVDTQVEQSEVEIVEVQQNEVEEEVVEVVDNPNLVSTPRKHNSIKSRFSDQRYPVFLLEPFHSDLKMNEDSVEKLNVTDPKLPGDNWLSTDIIDFLIKQGTPSWKPETLIVPTSNIGFLLDIYNSKAKSKKPQDKCFVSQYRQLYKHYTTKPFQILTLSCHEDHFFVIDMILDATSIDGYYYGVVGIYDSLVRSKRNNKQLINDAASDLLLKYEEFFKHYILYDMEIDKENCNILDNVAYGKCPIQQNSYDCGLFAYAILVHLMKGIKITETLFTQKDIDYFRRSLYLIFKASPEELKHNPLEYLSDEFIYSFFDQTYHDSYEDNIFVKYLHGYSDYVSPVKNVSTSTIKKNSNTKSTTKKSPPSSASNKSSMNQNSASKKGPPASSTIKKSPPNQRNSIKKKPNSNTKKVNSNTKLGAKKVNKKNKQEASEEYDTNYNSDTSEKLEEIVPYDDELFKYMFVHNEDGYETEIKSIQHLFSKIRNYEVESGVSLRTWRSQPKKGAYLFDCISHKGCKFSAKFGPRRGNKQTIFKHGNLRHKGKDRNGRYDDGHAFKQHITEIMEPIVDTVQSIKNNPPVANDIVKATKTLSGKTVVYDQAHQVLSKAVANNKFESQKNYELIIPYLEKFREKNEGSVVKYEKDKDSSITKLFVCPGIMNNKLRFCRPVCAMDAAHLSSEYKGTLYLAVIKSGNDELLPIAIGITEHNENYKGWEYFLENLHEACPNLTVAHRFKRCERYMHWSFISDRDKGLTPALGKIFPKNHHSNCLFHIRHNVKGLYGIKAGDIVQILGTTFSFRQEEKLLNNLHRISANALDYVLQMDAACWRNTEWLRNPSLPPRYSITTSNIAESANSMFKQARSFDWLKSLDKMLHIILCKISKLRLVHKDKKGMIASYRVKYKELYETAATYNCVAINEETYTYKIFLGDGEDYVANKSHLLDMKNRTCTCGYWQNNELMCVHCMAYCRVVEKLSLKEILEKPYCHYYSYEYLNKLYATNINPVIIDNLSSDTSTKPPKLNGKRQPGRPAIKRKRKRMKSERTIVCGNCGIPGHNKRRCDKPVGYKLTEEYKRTQVASAIKLSEEDDAQKPSMEDDEDDDDDNNNKLSEEDAAPKSSMEDYEDDEYDNDNIDNNDDDDSATAQINDVSHVSQQSDDEEEDKKPSVAEAQLMKQLQYENERDFY